MAETNQNPSQPASTEHRREFPGGATHWSSGPGNLTFDADCPACLAQRLAELGPPEPTLPESYFRCADCREFTPSYMRRVYGSNDYCEACARKRRNIDPVTDLPKAMVDATLDAAALEPEGQP